MESELPAYRPLDLQYINIITIKNVGMWVTRRVLATLEVCAQKACARAGRPVCLVLPACAQRGRKSVIIKKLFNIEYPMMNEKVSPAVKYLMLFFIVCLSFFTVPAQVQIRLWNYTG